MSIRCHPALVSLLLVCALTAPAAARVSPFVRLDFGGGDLRMTDVDKSITANQTELQAAGYPARFQKAGSAYGPSAAAGVWLTPAVRVGATYSYQKARHSNQLLSTDPAIYYVQNLDMRMSEVGVEAAVRFDRLQGLILGVNVAQGRAEASEDRSTEGLITEHLDGSMLDVSMTAKRTKPTYGAFIGIDQTNVDGVAGYIRAGFQYRDMGHMPGSSSTFNGVTTTPGTGDTVWMDFSGFYLKVGVGFDRVR